MPSFHQDGFLNALAATPDIDLRVVFAKDLTADRVQMGWRQEKRAYHADRLANNFALLDAIRIARGERDRLHIVNGIWAEPAFAAALCALGLSRSEFVVHAEAPDPTITRSDIKRRAQSAFGRWVARRALGVLAISRFAVDYYTSLGFGRERVYPFGYFRPADRSASQAGEAGDTARMEIVFVGQLIRRKGGDVLLDAIQPLFAEYPDLRLRLIGGGEQEAALRRQAAAPGMQARVTFAGVLPAEQVQERLAAAQVLVLPSRWDGWGMVVNEAFAVGLPVIASDQCGASDLIQPGVNGYVFRSEDAEDLRDCLRRFLNRRDRWAGLRAAAARTAQTISVEAAAAYFVECLRHMTEPSTPRPVPPWALLALSPGADR